MNIFSIKDITAAKVSQAWASLHDLWGMTQVLLLSVGLSELMGPFKEFVTRIQTLGRKSGKKFLCIYLKECVRITIHFINRSQYTRQQGGVIVKVDRSGLPTIIPWEIRAWIMQFLQYHSIKSTLVLRCALTVLSFYRVLQFRNLPNLASITDGFRGISDTLEIKELYTVLAWFPKILIGPIQLVMSESKGPNGPRATWFSGADALALCMNTEMFIAWLRVAFYFKRWGLIVWLVGLNFLVTPILPIMWLLKVTFPMALGRLSTIKEAAGKRRIIAITDWWTQTLLKPLHMAISKVLKIIPQDGTFDQWKPLETWVLPRLRLGAKAFSFDLSSATDRLPINLQVQILDYFFPGLGLKWKALLDREWIFQKKPVRYAVGQPMGAYSSWVMLALSHHVIVQLAALRAGWTSWFPHYALLGDDIVIADEDVARHYQSIIKSLGVEINLGKSIISETGLIEFAKRWAFGLHGEISAFPPGLLLGVWRNKFMLPIMILHLVNHNWLYFPSQLIGALDSLKTILRIRPKLMGLMLATLFGPSGLLKWDQSHLTIYFDKWLSMITGGQMSFALGLVIRSYIRLVTEHHAEFKSRADREMEYFINNWMNIPILQCKNLTVAGILSIPLMLASPGFYVYVLNLWQAVNSGMSASLNLAGLTGAAPASEESIKFNLLDITSLASISWKRKAAVKDQFKATSDLLRVISYEIAIDLQGLGPMVVYETPTEFEALPLQV